MYHISLASQPPPKKPAPGWSLTRELTGHAAGGGPEGTRGLEGTVDQRGMVAAWSGVER